MLLLNSTDIFRTKRHNRMEKVLLIPLVDCALSVAKYLKLIVVLFPFLYSTPVRLGFLIITCGKPPSKINKKLVDRHVKVLARSFKIFLSRHSSPFSPLCDRLVTDPEVFGHAVGTRVFSAWIVGHTWFD